MENRSGLIVDARLTWRLAGPNGLPRFEDLDL
jgi:hypothetical protein